MNIRYESADQMAPFYEEKKTGCRSQASTWQFTGIPTCQKTSLQGKYFRSKISNHLQLVLTGRGVGSSLWV
jgi:hypothetical protein